MPKAEEHKSKILLSEWITFYHYIPDGLSEANCAQLLDTTDDL